MRGVFTIICLEDLAEFFPAGRSWTIETVFIVPSVIQTTLLIRDVEGFVMSYRLMPIFCEIGLAAPKGVNTLSNLLISRLDPRRTFAAIRRVEADFSALKQYLLDVVP